MLISSILFVTNVSPNLLVEWELSHHPGTSLPAGPGCSPAGCRLFFLGFPFIVISRISSAVSCVGSLCSLGPFFSLLLPCDGTYFPKAEKECLEGTFFETCILGISLFYLHTVLLRMSKSSLRRLLSCNIAAEKSEAILTPNPLWLGSLKEFLF